MKVRANRVARPKHDVLRMPEGFGIDPGSRAKGHEIRGGRAGIAESTLADRRAEAVEKGVSRVQPVQHAFRAEITVGKDRSRPPMLDDLRPSRVDLFERLRPGYAREGAAAFAALAAQGVQDAVGAVNPL